MDQLANQAGLAKNTLYRIVGSKEALIQKVIIVYINNVQRRMSELIIKESDYLTAFEKVITMFPEMLNNFYTDSIQEIFLEYPSVEKTVRNHQDNMTMNIIAFIKMGIEKDVFREDVQPEFIFEVLQGTLLHFIKKGYKGEVLSEKLTIAFNCFFQGIHKKK